jgi:DNA-binding transcriptional MerR regulator
MNTYKTSEVARVIGIHPNTVRLYEKFGLIPKAERKINGYRVFTDFHVEQIKLARIALEIEIVQNGLRKQAISIIKTSALGKFSEAFYLTKDYIEKIKNEQKNAEEAIEITKELLSSEAEEIGTKCFTRKEAADYLNVSIDALRNWEMNGLLKIKRKENGYRVYRDEDLKLLKMIRSLRFANYSLSSILRMLNVLDRNPEANIRQVIDTPKEDEYVISVCDKLLTSLNFAEKNAKTMLIQIDKMKKQFYINNTL